MVIKWLDRHRATKEAKVATPRPRAIIRISSASLLAAKANVSTEDEEDVVEADNETTGRLSAGTSKGVPKAKTGSANRDNGRAAMRELEARMQDWAEQGWELAEDMRRLREFLYDDA